MKRDSQKGKLFAWERQFQEKSEYCRDTFRARCHNEMTLKDCETLAHKVCRHFKIKPVRVDHGGGRRCAYSYGGKIALPKWARQPVVVLHEMAHEVHRFLGRTGREAIHGREFLGIEMYLLVKFGGFDLKELIRTANEVGLDFDSQNQVRKRIRENAERREWLYGT